MIIFGIVKFVNMLSMNKNTIDENLLRSDHDFTMRLPKADKKIREIYKSMANTKYFTTEDIFIRLPETKGKTKMKLSKY